jgi:signal transduction protein with GAF and PtsI domain
MPKYLLERAVELLGCRSGVIYLWDDEQQVLIPKTWHGQQEWMRQVRFRLDEGIPGTVAHGRMGMIVNNDQTSPHAHPRSVQHATYSALVAEPPLYHDRLLGVITIDNEGTQQPFTEQDRKLLKPPPAPYPVLGSRSLCTDVSSRRSGCDHESCRG